MVSLLQEEVQETRREWGGVRRGEVQVGRKRPGERVGWGTGGQGRGGGGGEVQECGDLLVDANDGDRACRLENRESNRTC